MTAAAKTVLNNSPVEVGVDENQGWNKCRSGPITVWFKGWMHGMDGPALARKLEKKGRKPGAKTIVTLLEGIDGHYALAAAGPGWAVAAVDWVRSIPLAVAKVGDGWVIDDQPERLRRKAGLAAPDRDGDAVLSIAMAGYTIDDSVLYRGMELLTPGELIWIEPGGAQRHRYYIYRPWRVREEPAAGFGGTLAGTTLEIMERTLASLGGRCLVVPLSAGRDSRLIVSAARHLGYENVRCFAYGRAGNFEAAASRAIAERLGYPWTFVPATVPGSRRFFAGEDYARYLEFSDSGASVPFVQDMAALLALKKNGFVPPDAVIANGNSGDFISGNHIVPELRKPPGTLDEEARWERITDALLSKHFSLWRALETPENLARVGKLLRASITRAGGDLGDPETDHGLYEYAEFQDRQCKYVVTGQRIYEYLGHEWRLPLWDNAYLRFWEGVPLAHKYGQALYAQMLREANWGGVWRDIPVNRKSIRPRWLIPLRLAAKAMHAPLGRARWHRFERRFLQYWMEPTGNAACVPYAQVSRDSRGARHHIAWLAAHYLECHGVDMRSLPGWAA